jgi:predicted  nucleic acid-binding Zn-ribbon protein
MNYALEENIAGLEENNNEKLEEIKKLKNQLIQKQENIVELEKKLFDDSKTSKQKIEVLENEIEELKNNI